MGEVSQCGLVLAEEKWLPRNGRLLSLPMGPETGAQKPRVAARVYSFQTQQCLVSSRRGSAMPPESFPVRDWRVKA